MSNPYLNKEDIQQAFFACEFKDPNGVYIDNRVDVDLLELADQLVMRASYAIAKTERNLCIEFVRTLNTEVAKALEEKRGNL
jgi:hypothetical protein